VGATPRHPIGWAVGAVLLAAALTVARGPALASAAEIVVVVNDRVPATHLSRAEVRAIFLGQHQFWDGIRIVPVTYPDAAPIMQVFLGRVLGMGLKEYRSWWIKRIFREGDTPPVRVNSPLDALQTIGANPGGIGFVRADQLGQMNGMREVFRFEG
jgi:ABC-type phosphate transport system substrate-binding protein